MGISQKRHRATVAAWDWVGAYEADVNDADAVLDGLHIITLEEAFDRYKTAARVKAKTDFPDAIVDAYTMLRRMAGAQKRANAPERQVGA